MKNPLRFMHAALTLACVSSAFLSPDASAEGSPPLSDQASAALAAEKRPPAAVEAFLAHLLELDQRYKDAGGIPADRLLQEEGETIALLYCRAIGIDGPCAPMDQGTQTRYVAVPANGRGSWWWWLEGHTTEIGVIPELAYCPSPYGFVQISMDDENNANNNGRSGWIGTTASTNDTRWRFCKLDIAATNLFAPMDAQLAPFFTGAYAVQSFGMSCPISARRVIRYQDNEDTNNNNGFFGSIFPNSVSANGSWMVTCHFDNPPALSTLMTDFPMLPLHYGVYADHLGVTIAGAGRHPVGKVYQDDEDNFNLNFWIGSPAGTMQGGKNTQRFLMKVF